MLNLLETSLFIKKKINGFSPKIGLILGSGLGYFINSLNIIKKISYEEIPDFPKTTAPSHDGCLIFGYYNQVPIVVMQGRYHYYEGYNLDQVTFPVRVLKRLGIDSLIVTNASGGINKNFSPGDLVVIKDHINYSGVNPLIGNKFSSNKNRFIDMTYAYDIEYRKKIKSIFKRMGMVYNEAVYMYVTGPSYETPSEIKAFRLMGADCVGMSTVPEVIVARDESIRVLGISCISNMASGILKSELSEKEVVEVANSVKIKFTELLGNFIDSIEID